MNKKTKIYLFRHGKSTKEFEGSEKLTSKELELRKPLSEGALKEAEKLGKKINPVVFEAFRDEYNKFQELKNTELTVGDYLVLDFVNSGKIRSEQTIQGIQKGLGIGMINQREDYGLNFEFDQRYLDALKQAVANKEYPTTIDFLLNVMPEQFFKQNKITNPERTYSTKEIQQNMMGVLKRGIDRNLFRSIDLTMMVGHEPVLSLSTLDLTDNSSISDLDGKWKELEYAVFTAEKNHGRFPDVAMEFRAKQYDIGRKIYK